MTQKEIYCCGRAEYLSEYEGCSLTEGYARAEEEWNKQHKVNRFVHREEYDYDDHEEGKNEKSL